MDERGRNEISTVRGNFKIRNPTPGYAEGCECVDSLQLHSSEILYLM